MIFFMVCQGREIELLVGTDIRDGNGTTRIINWCGCFVQDPHPAVRALGFLPQEGHGVYVTRYCIEILFRVNLTCAKTKPLTPYPTRPFCDLK